MTDVISVSFELRVAALVSSARTGGRPGSDGPGASDGAAGDRLTEGGRQCRSEKDLLVGKHEAGGTGRGHPHDQLRRRRAPLDRHLPEPGRGLRALFARQLALRGRRPSRAWSAAEPGVVGG
jgi:hypothetical protein